MRCSSTRSSAGCWRTNASTSYEGLLRIRFGGRGSGSAHVPARLLDVSPPSWPGYATARSLRSTAQTPALEALELRSTRLRVHMPAVDAQGRASDGALDFDEFPVEVEALCQAAGK